MSGTGLGVQALYHLLIRSELKFIKKGRVIITDLREKSEFKAGNSVTGL
jgi:hypothetical protein